MLNQNTNDLFQLFKEKYTHKYDFLSDTPLGCGAYGVVYKAKDRDRSVEVAIKLFYEGTVPGSELLIQQLHRTNFWKPKKIPSFLFLIHFLRWFENQINTDGPTCLHRRGRALLPYDGFHNKNNELSFKNGIVKLLQA